MLMKRADGKSWNDIENMKEDEQWELICDLFKIHKRLQTLGLVIIFLKKLCLSFFF